MMPHPQELDLLFHLMGRAISLFFAISGMAIPFVILKFVNTGEVNSLKWIKSKGLEFQPSNFKEKLSGKMFCLKMYHIFFMDSSINYSKTTMFRFTLFFVSDKINNCNANILYVCTFIIIRLL